MIIVAAQQVMDNDEFYDNYGGDYDFDEEVYLQIFLTDRKGN